MSLSWGEPENDALAFGLYQQCQQPPSDNVEFASLAAEGIAVFVSSGDNGAWECFDPNTGEPLGIACRRIRRAIPNVTAVGGVNVQLDESRPSERTDHRVGRQHHRRRQR